MPSTGIFYPVYVSQGEDIDVIRRHITYVPSEEPEEDEEGDEAMLAKLRADAEAQE